MNERAGKVFAGARSAVSRKSGEINEWLIVVGCLMLLFYAACVLLQTQTTESFAGSGLIVQLVQPNPAILLQIPDLLLGHLSPSNVVIVIFGWGAEIAYLAAIVGYKYFHAAIGRHNIFLADACVGVAGIIVGFNTYSDFVYGQAVIHGFIGQVAFAAIVSFIVSSFGLAGFNFVKIGISGQKATA